MGMGSGGSGGLFNGTKGNTAESQISEISKGTSRASKTGKPGSFYWQADQHGNILSKTRYGKNGKPEYRDDLAGRPHYDKKSGQYLKRHRHIFKYNEKGQPIGEEVEPITD